MKFKHRFIHDYLLQGTSVAPTRVAIQQGEYSITYKSLSDKAAELSQRLLSTGIKPGDRVILKMENSIDAIAHLIACSMCGVVFVPMSSQLPARRMAEVVSQTGASLVIEKLDEEIHWQIVQLDSDIAISCNTISSDPAYIIYTSGSTGTPKGITMSHRAVVAFWCGMSSSLNPDSNYRIGTISPFQFDFSLLDLGLALGALATLVIVPSPLFFAPIQFLRYLDKYKITMMNSVPSVWAPVIAKSLDAFAGLECLEFILFAGEKFPVKNIRILMSVRPNLKIINCFGQSESIACTFYQLPNPLPEKIAELPIGKGQIGTKMFILDEKGKYIDEPFCAGELYLAADNLFSGYWKNPQETAKRLISYYGDGLKGREVFRTGDKAYFDEQGIFYYCGRYDHQVQIKGNRVELGEIDSALGHHSEIADVCTVAINAEDGLEIAAAVTLKTQQVTISYAEMRRFLNEYLPSYMVPTHFATLAEIPLTENGKFNRELIADIFTSDVMES